MDIGKEANGFRQALAEFSVTPEGAVTTDPLKLKIVFFNGLLDHFERKLRLGAKLGGFGNVAFRSESPVFIIEPHLFRSTLRMAYTNIRRLKDGRMSAVSRPKMDRTETYTYADYLMWDGPERWELIAGVPYLMASPTAEHQEISAALEFAMQSHLHSTGCRLYHAPMDLLFDESESSKNVVQPDIFVMCGEYRRGANIIGIPKLIVEILSPSTAVHDLIRKLNLYQGAGVEEYWIVDPATKTVLFYKRSGSNLVLTHEYGAQETIQSQVFDDMQIDLSSVFS